MTGWFCPRSASLPSVRSFHPKKLQVKLSWRNIRRSPDFHEGHPFGANLLGSLMEGTEANVVPLSDHYWHSDSMCCKVWLCVMYHRHWPFGATAVTLHDKSHEGIIEILPRTPSILATIYHLLDFIALLISNLHRSGISFILFLISSTVIASHSSIISSLTVLSFSILDV